MKFRICLVSTGQPSTNPRIVKEADSLVEAGYEVVVLCTHWTKWADNTDKQLLSKKKWRCKYSGGSPDNNFHVYYLTRFRHKLYKKILSFGINSSFIRENSLFRSYSELEKQAKNIEADLYIAHNLGALPIAVKAAEKYGAKVGFDAEDFHSGMFPDNERKTQEYYLTELIEKKYIKKCDYITAASPGIAKAYKEKYGIQLPKIILNVFPLSMRPSRFRITNEKKPLSLFWFSQTIGSNRGLKDIIKAMGQLEGLNIELNLLGKWQQSYEDKLFKLVDEIGINKKMIKHHKPIDSDQVISLAGKFDIGLALEQPVSMNRNICLTNKIFSYLLAGTAIIATNTNGQSEFINENNLPAKLYNPGDIRALSSILRYWYKNQDDLNLNRKKSWEIGGSILNWDIEKHKFLELVKNTLIK